MNVKRTILRPLAYVAGLHASAQARAFLAAHSRTAQTQQRLLSELVRRHADTAFGREHGLGAVRSYEDFIKAVPVRTYDQLRPWMRRVFEGDSRAMFPQGEDVLMFSRTSGTTGEPKHIPVTRTFLEAMRRGWNVFGLISFRHHRQAWLRSILQISSSMSEATSPCGKPCGAISGLLAATQKRIVRRMYPAPAELAGVRDQAARLYALVRCAAEHDVGIITTANPSTTIQLVQTAQEHAERLVRDLAQGECNPPGDLPEDVRCCIRVKRRPDLARRLERGISADGKLLPRHLWRLRVLYNWTGGTLGLYLPQLRELFDAAPVRDIGLLASEGRFSIPIADGAAAGPAEVTSNVLEFMPVDQADSASPLTVRAHEAQVGQEYFLVVTNWAGLWRYNLDDRVRVTGRIGEGPVIEFLSRGRHTANITGEKLTEHQVVAAMAASAGAEAAQVQRFTLEPHFADQPYYLLTVECDATLAGRLAGRLDAALAQLNVEYASKRHSERLGPVRAACVAPGTFVRREAQEIARRNGRGEQYKHQYLLTAVVTDAAGA